MINSTAKRTGQWLVQNTSTRSSSAKTSSAGISPIKQALMPRSLDLNFSLKYRR